MSCIIRHLLHFTFYTLHFTFYILHFHIKHNIFIFLKLEMSHHIYGKFCQYTFKESKCVWLTIILLAQVCVWQVISWCDLGWFGTYGKAFMFQVWRNPGGTRAEPSWGCRRFRQTCWRFCYKYQTICSIFLLSLLIIFSHIQPYLHLTPNPFDCCEVSFCSKEVHKLI